MLDDTNENIQKKMRKRKRAFLKKDFRCSMMRMKIYEKKENAKAKTSISENDLIAEVLEVRILYR